MDKLQPGMIQLDPDRVRLPAAPKDTHQHSPHTHTVVVVTSAPLALALSRQVGSVVRLPAEVQAERQRMALEAEVARRHEQEAGTDERRKMKGRRRASRVHRRKQTNVIDEKCVRGRARACDGGLSVLFR